LDPHSLLDVKSNIMAEVITNITNPGEDPVHGDIILRTGENWSSTEQMIVAGVPTASEIAQVARDWRDGELSVTDYIVPTTDHPQHAAYIAYRAALRAWPASSDFPATRPVLGT